MFSYRMFARHAVWLAVSVLGLSIAAPEASAVLVTLRLVDQDNVAHPFATFLVESTYVSQDGTIDLSEGPHPMRVYAGSQINRLYREETLAVPASPGLVPVQWDRGPVRVTVLDQFLSAIPASFWIDENGYTGVGHASGGEALLPVTDDPAILGFDATGHSFRIWPGINMIGHNNQLARTHGPIEVTSAERTLEYQWKVAPLTLHVRDQLAQTIPGSTWVVYGTVLASGGSVMLPVTEDPTEPTISGNFADGYDLSIFPGINGVGQNNLLRTEADHTELDADGTEVEVQWTVVNDCIRVVDINGASVASSRFSIRSIGDFPSGTSLRLPITTDPSITALFANGYDIRIRPGPSNPYYGYFDFELDASGTFSPAFVTIEGSSYGLRPCPVPVEVSDLRALASGDGIAVDWQLSQEARSHLAGVHVERALEVAGSYERRTVGALVPESEMHFEDRTVEPGRTYWYRLVLQETDGAESIAGPVSVTSGRSLRTGLVRVAQSRTTRDVRIVFGTSGANFKGDLAVFDSAGRRVWSTSVSAGAAGEHEIAWDERGPSGRRVARGVYNVRMQGMGTTSTRKLVLLAR